MKRLTCFLCVAVSSLVFAGDERPRAQLVREMVRASSPSNTIAEIRAELYAAMPKLKHFPDSWDRFIAKQTPVLVNACAQGFASQLSADELKELTAIFKRPVMQKYLAISGFPNV